MNEKTITDSEIYDTHTYKVSVSMYVVMIVLIERTKLENMPDSRKRIIYDTLPSKGDMADFIRRHYLDKDIP